MVFFNQRRGWLALFLGLASLSVCAQGQPAKEVKRPQTSTAIDTLIAADAKEALLDNIPIVSIDENDNQDGSAQNVSSQLSAGRDPYFNGATFHFNAVRFRLRGYDGDMFSSYMNGVQMENLDNGFTPFGLWGGLNDVVRNRDAVLGLRSTPYGIGDIGGLTSLDTRASRQRKQTSFNYASSNRNYFNRIMLTHSTGLNQKGWAFSFSGSRRWATEGYVPGTYFDGYSLYVGVDKRFNDRHLLSFVGFYTPTENGRQGSSVQEMVDLAGDNFYNPFWGYQNGKKRNVSVARTNQPVFVLTHDWKVNDKTTLVTAASFITGTRAVSGFDWYNAPDPRPDYYRYLPSFQTDPTQRQLAIDAFRSDVNLRQINWDRLYNANYGNFETVKNVGGIAGNDRSGRRSIYVVEDRVVGTNRLNFNTTLNTSLSENIDFTAGASYQYQNNHYYKELNDLLGGEFYVDLNQFAERDFGFGDQFNQNDLNNPNRILKEGDRFGYNYNITIQRAAAWAQANVKFRKIDFFVAAEHSYTNFFRTGNVRTGIFPDNSFGKSKVNRFYNYMFKGGVTYKLDGRNYFYFDGAYQTRAPFFDNAYIAPRTRDIVQDNLRNEQIGSLEAGYVLNAPNVKARINGFYTNFKNQSNVLTFYDEQFRNFVNYAISNIGREHMGVEIGLEAKVYRGWSVNAAANIGRYYFTTRQNITISRDNTAELLRNDIVYSKNFRVPTPQEAYTVGFSYRSPRFWFVNANINFFDQMWFDFNPARRTYGAVEGLDPESAQWRGIVDQTRLPSEYTIDIFAGYSWRMNNRFKSLKKSTFLVFNVGVNNLLNNTGIVSGGFEQLRFDFQTRDINKFPPRRFFGYGLNYFASVGVRF